MFAVGGGRVVVVRGGVSGQWMAVDSFLHAIDNPPPATAERGERLSSGLRVALPLMAY